MTGPATKTTLDAIPGLSPELQRTLAAAGVGLYHFDTATQTFAIDATCRRLFDLDPAEELSPDVMVRRIHPEDLDRYWVAAAAGMQGGDFGCDYRVVWRDGSVRFVSGRAHAVPLPGGAGQRLAGVVIDVTARRSLEAELLATQSQMEHLADGVPGLFAFIDRNYVIRFLSRQYDAWFGYPRERHLHQHVVDVVGPADFLRRKARYDQAMAGETVSCEEPRTMADGGLRHFAMTYRAATGADGQLLGVVSLGIDITERRAMERALEAKSAELARSNRELEQFAYVASHDLKAPLRAIDILVEWLQDDLRDYAGGEVQGNLGLLKQRTARLHRLLDDLLAYSRAGRRPGAVVETDTRLMVQDLATLLAPPPGLAVVADGTLPVLWARAAPLEQVLRNLVNNAIKHHPTGQGLVRVGARECPGGYEFTVTDDGAGIPPEFATRVFQMFQTLRPRDEVEGSGMGLAIVKRIVEWQGGRVWFEPGPGGRGTTFRFTWRALAPADDNTATMPLPVVADLPSEGHP